MTNIVTIDYDVGTQRMFWADTANNKIYSADLANGGNLKVVSVISSCS